MATPRSHEPAADPDMAQVHPDDLLDVVNGKQMAEPGGRDRLLAAGFPEDRIFDGDEDAVVETVRRQLAEAETISTPGTVELYPATGTRSIAGDVIEAAIVPPGRDLPATPEADAGVLAMLNSANDPWADVADGDMAPSVRRIPYLKINRNMDGGITLPDGEVKRDLDFIWMAKGMSRAWFKDAFGKGESIPGCRSADGVTADPQSPDMQNGGSCVGCPMAEFEDDRRPGGAPRCREGVEALVFLPDPHGYGQLARMRWNGIAVGPAKRFWDSFFTRMPKVPPIGFVSHVDLEATDTTFGQKLAPVFHRVSELGRQEAQPLIVERDARMKDWVADTASDLAEGVGQDDETTGAPQGDPFGDPADDYTGPDF